MVVVIDWYLDWHQSMIDFWRDHETLLAVAWAAAFALGITQAIIGRRRKGY